MKILIFILLAFSLNAFAFKQTDYACVNDCTNKGYQYNFCQAQCSYETQPNTGGYQFQQPIKQTDYKCVSDCTAKGYQYNYCTNLCSF